MKKLKKLCITMLFAGVMLFTVVGCGNKEETNPKTEDKVQETNDNKTVVEGNLAELMDQINSSLDQEVKDRLFVMELDEDNEMMFLGSNDIDYKEAVASENLIGSIAHSVILLRANENENMTKLKEQIAGSINPRKWICVGVENEDVIIKNRGDLVIVIIVADEANRTAIEAGFDAL